MTTQPFVHNERSYTFLKRGSEVIPVRDDGAMPWSTYRSYTIGDLANMTTSVHRVVWAATDYDAKRIREQEDIDASTANP